MTSQTEELQEELTCSVCIELFTEPVTFPCMHSFCRQCVLDVMQHSDPDVVSGTVLPCPQCREEADIGPGGSSLRRNHGLANMVEIFRRSNQDASTNANAQGNANAQRNASSVNMPHGLNQSAFSNATAPPLSSSQMIQSSAPEEEEDFSWVEPLQQFLSTSSEATQIRVTCNACRNTVRGVRYTCRECEENYNLCRTCERAGRHDKHDMIKVVSSRTSFPRIVYRTETSIFRSTKITCNACRQPISGVRFHCYVCEDFDLCRTCERRNAHPDHDMRRVVSAKLFRNNVPTADEARRMKLNGYIFPRVTCDACNGAVIGFRYKCVVCGDYDLCATCLVAGNHAQHDMRRIDPPNQKI